MSVNKLKYERGLIVAEGHFKHSHSMVNTSKCKASFGMPKEERFKWQVKTDHNVIAYSSPQEVSSFKLSNSRS